MVEDSIKRLMEASIMYRYFSPKSSGEMTGLNATGPYNFLAKTLSNDFSRAFPGTYGYFLQNRMQMHFEDR
jgi:hypothetical protein